MINLIQSIKEITEVVIVKENASFIREGARSGPVIVCDSLSVAIVSFRVIIVKQDDVEFLIQEVIGLQKMKEKEKVRRQETRRDK
jgi:hypothetical protein